MSRDAVQHDHPKTCCDHVAPQGMANEHVGPKESSHVNPAILPTLQWLYELMGQCPNWKAQWLKRFKGGQKPMPLTFFNDHQHLASLIDAMPHAHALGGSALQSIERVLVAQFPLDPAWKQAIRHRVGLSRSKEKSRKHGAAYLPRILAERRNAVVLIRNEIGAWQSQKNAKASQVLHKSGEERRAFLETLMGIPSLLRIEIPAHMDFAGAALIAIDVQQALATQGNVVLTARKEGRGWSLALRRIQSMGLKGCFDSASQTVIVDPRHLQSIKHEVCHWLLDHGIDTHDRKNFLTREREVETLTEKLFPDKP